VEWLVNNGFPGLFWSRSTNGRGVHAYVRVDKPETNARGLDGALLEFERWLKYQFSIHRWDIEGIEVKGRPPIFTWGDERHELLGLKMGSLAKIPVEALDRPVELMNTTVKRVDELRRLGEEVPGDSEREMGEDNCTIYCVSISPDPTEGFGTIDPEGLREIPFIPGYEEPGMAPLGRGDGQARAPGGGTASGRWSSSCPNGCSGSNSMIVTTRWSGRPSYSRRS